MYPYSGFYADIDRHIRDLTKAVQQLSGAYGYQNRLGWAHILLDKLKFVKQFVVAEPAYQQEKQHQHALHVQEQHNRAMENAQNRIACAQERAAYAQERQARAQEDRAREERRRHEEADVIIVDGADVVVVDDQNSYYYQ